MPDKRERFRPTPPDVTRCDTDEEVVRWIAERCATTEELQALGDAPAGSAAQDVLDDLILTSRRILAGLAGGER